MVADRLPDLSIGSIPRPGQSVKLLGGDEGTRTPDFLLAKEALSH
jgi:hypothetical protein